MVFNPTPMTGSPNTPGGVGKKRSDLQSGHSVVQRKHPYRYGTIIEVKKIGGATSVPYVRVRFEDTGKESEWIPLQDHPMAIAQNYSSRLDDLVGNYRCKIETQTGNSSYGMATIVANREVDELNYDPDVEISGLRLA